MIIMKDVSPGLVSAESRAVERKLRDLYVFNLKVDQNPLWGKRCSE